MADKKYRYNPIPNDFKYGPWESLAIAKAAIPISIRYGGLTVAITGLGEYNWLEADLTDNGLVAKTSGGGGGGFAKTNCVYLVGNATDQTSMGGTANNVYTTFQAAYDAAVILQVALGGSNKVMLYVGNTTVAQVGNLILTANYNTNVIIEGTHQASSLLGTITATVTNISIICSNVDIGAITTGGGAGVTLRCFYSRIGNIDISTLTGNTGSVVITLSYNTIFGNITATALAGITGQVNISGSELRIGVVNTSSTALTGNYQVRGISCAGVGIDSIYINSIIQTKASSNATNFVTGGILTNTNVTGSIIITGYVNESQTKSNVNLSGLTIDNCVIGGDIVLNGNTAGNLPAGGWVENFTLINTIVKGSVKIYQNPIAQQTAPVFTIKNCNILGEFNFVHTLTNHTNLDITNTFVGTNFTINSPGGNYNPVTANPLSLRNLTVGGNCSISTFLSTSAPTSFLYDVLLHSLVVGGSVTLINIFGDSTFDLTNISCNNFNISNNSATSPVRRNRITNCNLDANSVTLYNTNSILLDIKNSYIGFQDDTLPVVRNILATNSTIDTTKCTAGVLSTLAGTLNVCVLIRRTSIVSSATLNAGHEIVL